MLRALDHTVEDGGSEIAPFAQGAFAAVGGAPLWITHEMEWFYPDNPYLWRFFLHYARERVHPGHGTPGATHFHDATLEVQHR